MEGCGSYAGTNRSPYGRSQETVIAAAVGRNRHAVAGLVQSRGADRGPLPATENGLYSRLGPDEADLDYHSAIRAHVIFHGHPHLLACRALFFASASIQDLYLVSVPVTTVGCTGRNHKNSPKKKLTNFSALDLGVLKVVHRGLGLCQRMVLHEAVGRLDGDLRETAVRVEEFKHVTLGDAVAREIAFYTLVRGRERRCQ